METGKAYEVIKRRWTDELTRTSSAAREVTTTQEQQQLKQLYESPQSNRLSSQDFEIANVAREQLQKIIDKFNEDLKPSTLQQLGFSYRSAKSKVADVLSQNVDGDINDLKGFVDNLEAEWKQKHGPVYLAFKKICSTLDDHKSILKVFPSQNDYASPLVGSVTILMKAAKSHSEISLILSKSIAEISDKVATCSNILTIIKTSRARRKLADVYAHMFQFYLHALDWYMQSRVSRLVRSFNENLLKAFEDTKKDVEESITELYREAAVANTAIVAMVNGKVSRLEAELYRQRHSYETRDMLAGQRMNKMFQATWTKVKQLESTIKFAALNDTPEQEQQSDCAQEVATIPLTSQLLQASKLHLDAFIIDNEGPPYRLDKAHLWIVDQDVLVKLRTWMTTKSEPQTLWISSPYEPNSAVTGSRAAVMASVAAAWQAETPIISASCKRPHHHQLRPGLSIEQVGLLSLIYSFIRQLLQFNHFEREIEIQETDLTALNGEASSWDAGLRFLRTLLRYTPVVTFCVIDGLNDFECGDGAMWCRELLDVLMERQRQPGGLFNVLFSTAGQSLVLPQYVGSRDRHMTVKRAREVRRKGRGIPHQLGPS